MLFHVYGFRIQRKTCSQNKFYKFSASSLQISNGLTYIWGLKLIREGILSKMYWTKICGYILEFRILLKPFFNIEVDRFKDLQERLQLFGDDRSQLDFWHSGPMFDYL